MKKFLSVIIAAVMTSAAMAAPAAADTTGAEITEKSVAQSGVINVDYAQDVSYTVHIPASVTFTDEETTVERGLLAEGVVLNEGSSLNVNISSLNDFQMKNGAGAIDYYLQINYATIPEENNYTLMTVKAGEGSGWAILEFKTDLSKENAVYAGTYTDTLTFTVSIS